MAINVCARCGGSVPEIKDSGGKVWLFCRTCNSMIEKMMKESKADG